MSPQGDPENDAELRALIEGRRTLAEERWANHLREHSLHDQFHQREHEQTETAIAKAEASTKEALIRAQQVIDERFASTNEWRSAFSDRERAFLTKTEYTSAYTALQQRLDSLEDKELTRQTRETERERSTLRTMALIGLAATVASVVLSFLIKL